MPGKVLFLLLLSVGTAYAQEDRWIALVDVSGSSDQVDQERRLRRESLALSQIFLAAAAEVDASRRSHLSVYFFGNDVQSANLSESALRWDYVPVEVVPALPPGMGNRSKLDLALERAIAEFKQATGFARKHLLIVSDGELDVGDKNRSAGGRFDVEELEAYKTIFSQAVPALRALDVTVDAIAIHEGGLTEDQIQARLLARGADTVEQQFLRFLDDQYVAAMPIGEGPYFLHALARSLGGRSRLASESQLAEAMWQTIFPSAVLRRAVTPGARALVVFAGAREPVKLCLDDHDRRPDVVIRRDPQTGSVSYEPPGHDVDARDRATANHAVWLIRAPSATCVEPGTAYHGNNVELRWAQSDPSWRRLDIRLELVKSVDTEPSLDWWRKYLGEMIASGQISALARVWPPDGSKPVDVPLQPEVSASAQDAAVLRLAARDWVRSGRYRAEVKLLVGQDDVAWEEVVAPTTLLVPPIPVAFYLALLAVVALVGWIERKPMRRGIDDARFWWQTRRTPFDFIVDWDGGPTVTHSRHPRTVRAIVSGDKVDVSSAVRTNGGNATAFFEARGPVQYGLVANAGGWEYRKVTPKDRRPPDFVPLGPQGITISILDFVRERAVFDIRHGLHTMRIRHAALGAPLVHARSDTRAN